MNLKFGDVVAGAVLLGAGSLIANSLNEKVKPDTIVHVATARIIKPTTLDNFGRPNLKFILGDTPEYLLFDTGNPISNISTKVVADRINIKRYPKSKDGYILPVTLPDVGSMTVKAFIEDRGANLISPMLFTKFYDVEFSKEVIVFDPNKIRPAIPYAHSSNPDVRPVIRVNVGASWVDLVIDSGADQNGISSVLASICKVNNYPVIHVPLHESLGKTRQATYQVGYQVPVYIPGAFSGIRTFYISNIRKSNLSLLSATQFLEQGYRLRYSETGITFIPPPRV